MAPRNRSDSYDSTLQSYLRDISDIDPLTKSEERALARSGDERAVQELVKHNLKYVVMVANRYKGLGLSLTDLINEGNVGMIHAARRFDPDKRVKFITYAVWWIRQSIIKALADQAQVVRLPVKQAGLLHEISKRINLLAQKLKREPTLDELAQDMKIKRVTLEVVMRVYRSYMSLDSPLSDDGSETNFIDVLTSGPVNSIEEDFVRLCLHHDIQRLLKTLDRREEKVLRLRFGFDGPPMTLKSIGARFGLTRERIRQIEKLAKQKLRSKIGTTTLEEYLH